MFILLHQPIFDFTVLFVALANNITKKNEKLLILTAKENLQKVSSYTKITPHKSKRHILGRCPTGRVCVLLTQR